MNKRALKISGILLIGAALGIAGTTIYYSLHKPQISLVKIRDNTNYALIRPLLAIDFDQNAQFAENISLKNKLEDYINSQKSSGKISEASVYYKNLQNGQWAGVDEYAEYSPASLFKVPILIAYLKEAESDPNLLSTKYTFDNKADIAPPQDIPPSQKIEFGQSYTVEELIKYMIQYSDNNAANVLAERIMLDQKNSYTEIMSDLGIDVMQPQAHISPKNYSLFFRIIYNSTYLTESMSEKAMEILAGGDFNDGLVAGVPKGTTVAHKFGEAPILDKNNQLTGEELHDCGIVYDKTPYVLCVMTKGTKIPDLESVIRDISSMVYSFKK